jgi:hypothetical protein
MKNAAICVLVAIVVSTAVSADKVERYDVLETSVATVEKFDNPFTGAQLHGKFTGPDGKSIDVAGFYFQGSEWRIRFAPNQTGEWSYSLELTCKEPCAQRVNSSASIRSVTAFCAFRRSIRTDCSMTTALPFIRSASNAAAV